MFNDVTSSDENHYGYGYGYGYVYHSKSTTSIILVMKKYNNIKCL